MRYRLDHVVLDHPFTVPNEMMQGRSKDGNLSASDRFILDRIDDTLIITHQRCVEEAAKTGRPLYAKTVPWTSVAECRPAEEQPEWSDWPDLLDDLYPETLKPAPAPTKMAGQSTAVVDGRTKEARAAKAAAVAT